MCFFFFFFFFYHIWEWRPSWSAGCYHFRHLSFPWPTEAPYEILSKFGSAASEEKLFEILNNCPIQMYGAHTNAQGSNFGRSPVPDDLYKYLVPRPPRFWRRGFLKFFFTVFGHGGHLGQRTATILTIFRSPTLKRLHIKFEQIWLSGFRGEVVWNSQQFSHTNVMGLI